MRTFFRMNRSMRILFCLLGVCCPSLLLASSIDLFSVSEISSRKSVANVRDDGSFDFQVLLPLQDRGSDYLNRGRSKPLLPFLLHYNSLQPNGLVGQGWNIEFFSFISRCSSTETGLSLNQSSDELDAFCLDGKPLHSFSNGWSGYRGVSATGQRVSVMPSDDCNGSPCQFIVRSETGEVRYYGGPDHNSLNGDASIRNGNNETLVWALKSIDRGQARFNFDYYLNALDGNPTLETVESEALNSYGQVEYRNFYELIYGGRWNHYEGDIDGIRLSLTNVLSAIHIYNVGRSQRASGRLIGTVNFNYQSEIQDKTVTQVDSCQWSPSGRSCRKLAVESPIPEGPQGSSNIDNLTFGFTFPPGDFLIDLKHNYHFLVGSTDCRRKWQLPYQHFFQCDNYFLNAIKVEKLVQEVDSTNEEITKIAYGFIDSEVRYSGGQRDVDRLTNKERPWQIVKSVTREKITPSTFRGLDDLKISFKWYRPSTEPNRWNGFMRRQALIDQYDYEGSADGVDITSETYWQQHYDLKVPTLSSVWDGPPPNLDAIAIPGFGPDNVRLSCQYTTNYLGLVDQTVRIQQYKKGATNICRKEEEFAHNYYHDEKNEIVNVGSFPNYCEIPYSALPLSQLTYKTLIEGGVDELPAQNSCDLVADFIVPAKRNFTPQGRQFPIFRPPGVPAPEIPSETDTVEDESE